MHIDFFQLTNQERLGGTNMIEYDADKHADSKKFKFLMKFQSRRTIPIKRIISANRKTKHLQSRLTQEHETLSQEPRRFQKSDIIIVLSLQPLIERSVMPS
jgi:hypothetical protein